MNVVIQLTASGTSEPKAAAEQRRSIKQTAGADSGCKPAVRPDTNMFVSSGPPLTPAELQRKTDWPIAGRATWYASSHLLIIPQDGAGCGEGPCTYYISVELSARFFPPPDGVLDPRTSTSYRIEASLRAAREAIILQPNVPYRATYATSQILFFAVVLLPDRTLRQAHR
jgi:hypothetical protein